LIINFDLTVETSASPCGRPCGHSNHYINELMVNFLLKSATVIKINQ